MEYYVDCFTYPIIDIWVIYDIDLLFPRTKEDKLWFYVLACGRFYLLFGHSIGTYFIEIEDVFYADKSEFYKSNTINAHSEYPCYSSIASSLSLIEEGSNQLFAKIKYVGCV